MPVTISTPPPATDQVALAGPDGHRAATLLADAKARGATILNHLARRAITRVVRTSDPLATLDSAEFLLSAEERAALADALAAVTATADLLGRSRVRERAAQAELRHSYHVDFAEGDSFLAFADPPPPLQPTAAIDYFKGLVPTIGVDPATFAPAITRTAFTMAAATDAVLLERVKGLILGALESGQSGTPQAIDDLLRAAGVAPQNAQYSSMVFRTNAMDAYNRGAAAELEDPLMQEYFPVWQYAGIRDGRQGKDHEPHFDKYYPSSATFEEVRGDRPYNCRCTFIPTDKFTWADLRAKGVQVETDW